ncbi:TPA: hypothetical protein SIC70_002149 [Pasteurella multocida]|uniref:hypothetical protein n=1 Tax=Pasteurella multocida TaxID=747 RepID=UPI0029B9E306|nr:hypothetical protein [Pasteurella multocida]MEB4587004.1 hypothetical protein [Pasteurella multocida]HEH9717244.1 hypothetical protein [Pasteurella multocida]HEH9728186.1 hypothetical protein [Pasteurella multocida]HEH9735313.1 hypothetical protein [Pasteurella multocida]HEH9766920.1 hypothetical protein [Pasteurella multocida]
MPKYVARIWCLVEATVKADSIEEVTERVCDLNQFDINQVPHFISEIDEVMEVEEL